MGVPSDRRCSLACRHTNTCTSFHMWPVCRCLCQKVCTRYSANRFKVPLLMCRIWHLFILRAPVLLIIVLRKESVFTAKIPLILPVNTRQWDWRLCSQWIATDCSRLLSTMPVGAYCSLDCVDKYLTFVCNILWHVFH